MIGLTGGLYSRLDLVGEPLPQDESEGGEDHGGRAHDLSSAAHRQFSSIEV